MKRHVVKYYFSEGVRSIFLHGFMSFAAVGVIIACLIIMGSFSLLAVNIRSAIEQLEQSNEIIAYVDDGLTDAQARSLSSRINTMDNVLKSEFVSREEAFEAFDEQIGEEALLGLDATLLQHRYHITLIDLSLTDETIRAIELTAGIAEVKYSSDLVSALLNMRRFVDMLSVVLVLVLLIISLFIMSNTIKLATFDRREEIGIMRIVGATKSFVRWPFVVEGLLLGSIAGIAAFFFQWGLYNWFGSALMSQLTTLPMVPFGTLLIPLVGIFVLTGSLVGIGGSVLTIRKFLRT